MPTDLTLIYLNYNTPDWIHKALSSLHKNYLSKTKLNINVVVVDNQSTDDSVEQIRKEFPWAEMIVAPKNGGFAYGNNVALKKANSRYVMLVNSDVECTKESNFDELVLYMDAHEEVSVITPTVVLANGELDRASHRGEPTPWASLMYFSGMAKLFPKVSFLASYHLTDKPLDEIHEIDACSGAAMLVRTSAMKKVGLLDERFFMYAEDLDWCKRFRDQGGKIIFYPIITVIHHKYKSGRGKTGDKVSEHSSKHFYQTMLQYFDKHYGGKYYIGIRLLLQMFIWIKTH